MINIGIDVGKSRHCASVLDDRTGEWIYVPFFFTNDKAGFENLYEKIRPYLNRKHAVGMECTGHYMYNLVHFLLEKKCTVMYINPRSTYMRRKELGRTAKNDKLDSKLITEMLSEKKFWQHVTEHSLELDELRELTRVYHQLVEQQNQDQNRLQRALDIVFPEYSGLSWKSYGTAYMNVLKRYPSAAIIASTDIRSLRNVLATKARGRKSSVTAEILKTTARDSIGDAHNVAVELEVQSVIAIIEARAEQIDILPRQNNQQYVLYRQVDLALDPFPCCGGTTSCDSLWMGTPFVSLAGRTFVSRMGVTLLHSVGLDELIADNEAQYIATAVALANDLPRLRALRKGLRERVAASPLMNAPRFALSKPHTAGGVALQFLPWDPDRTQGQR